MYKGRLKILNGYGIFFSVQGIGKHWQPGLAVSNQRKDRERQKGKIQLWATSVFDLQWPQDTNPAVNMHAPNSHAIAYALDAVFQVKIIGYVGTYVTPSIYLNTNKTV